MKETKTTNVWSDIARQRVLARLRSIRMDSMTPWFLDCEIECMRSRIDDELFDIIDKAMNNNLWICPIKMIEGDDAYYSISKKEIIIPCAYQYDDNEVFYGEVLHNMAHSTGSELHLDRLSNIAYHSGTYPFEELVAELSAAYIAAGYGCKKYAKGDSLDYVDKWISDIETYDDYIDKLGRSVQACVKFMVEAMSKIAKTEIADHNEPRL